MRRAEKSTLGVEMWMVSEKFTTTYSGFKFENSCRDLEISIISPRPSFLGFSKISFGSPGDLTLASL